MIVARVCCLAAGGWGGVDRRSALLNSSHWHREYVQPFTGLSLHLFLTSNHFCPHYINLNPQLYIDIEISGSWSCLMNGLLLLLLLPSKLVAYHLTTFWSAVERKWGYHAAGAIKLVSLMCQPRRIIIFELFCVINLRLCKVYYIHLLCAKQTWKS